MIAFLDTKDDLHLFPQFIQQILPIKSKLIVEMSCQCVFVRNFTLFIHSKYERGPAATTLQGGAWWDVARPEISDIDSVRDAHPAYVQAKAARDRGAKP